MTNKSEKKTNIGTFWKKKKQNKTAVVCYLQHIQIVQLSLRTRFLLSVNFTFHHI